LFVLSERFGIPVSTLANSMTVNEVMEYLAFDMTNSEEFRDKVKREKELEESRKLSAEEYAKQFKRLMGGGR